ncbi:RICIN domain-containing protein [Micromonospora sp. WMMA1363]|uniref:RICIN domain-containing protein n=1 Tax=Micromonospora sp. WMMA1363 TaxID=3053985 RepID=UPI00259CF93E|nr:RICIN domain-containing protein [Micromonospora sp. WMMA1363]MDM4723161.1 RICIN domain-containing protein [Micromonospora sp. WMMA1363]
MQNGALVLRRRRWKLFVATFVALMVSMAGVITTAGSARAGVSDPLALGQATEGDGRVLGVLATTTGTRVKAVNYQVGTGAAVAMQRWTFERVSVGGPAPETTYRIRNAASDLCLEKSISGGDVSGAVVHLATCASVTHQYWYTPAEPTYPGYTLRSMRDNRCLDVALPDDGADVDVWTCYSFGSQLWKIRYGVLDCEEGPHTVLCLRPTERIKGLIGTWKHQPVQFTGPDYNRLSNFMLWKTSRDSGEDTASEYFEMGWQADYDDLTASTTHTAYWVESSDKSYEWHSLATEPGGDAANGMTHTYMTLANDEGQWDIFFDFNVVGTTTAAEGGRANYIENGIYSYFDGQIVLATGFQNRPQIMTTNEVFRRIYVGESGIFANAACHAPPNDPSYGGIAEPPECYQHTLATRQGNNVLEVDHFTIEKPQGTTLALPDPAPRQVGEGFVNGVDQAALADCLQSQAAGASCLRTVPGLAECVAARAICNGLDAGDRRQRDHVERPKRVQDLVDRLLAGSTGEDLAPARAANIRAGAYTAATGKAIHGVRADDTILVLSGDDRVKDRRASDGKLYSGYRAAFRADTGGLLHVCLGDTCRSMA